MLSVPHLPKGSFAHSVWLHLVLPRAAILAALWAMNQSLQLPVWLVYPAAVLDAGFLVWQLWRYHQAAEAHIRDTGAMAPSWGGYLLCLLALLSSATLWWDTVLIANRPPPEEQHSEQMRRAREALYQLTLSADGRTAQFEGEITYGLKARLTQIIEDTPDLRVIHLGSPGGHVFEARGAAQVIMGAGLETRVSEACSSACTLLFMAGTRRHLDPQARLGFHGYGLSEWVHLPGYDIDAAQEKDRAFFLAQGMQPGFAARIFDRPPEEMWYPDHAELRTAGVLTSP
ncbi:MAG: hypothetical protein EpisKO_26580 [Epibacterium sp.]